MIFFFNDTATTEIYTLSLHDALPISYPRDPPTVQCRDMKFLRISEGIHGVEQFRHVAHAGTDRKSTRLNSSHGYISYAVFCLKKNKRRRCAADHPRSRRELALVGQ